MNRAPKPTYAQKLKDPRWQKKRLEVLQADEFTCQFCGDSESTLHVHHRQYLKGREPWEYEREQLVTLCEECHSGGHDREDVFLLVASYLDVDGPRSREAMAAMVAGFCNTPIPFPEDQFDHYSAMVGILAYRLFGGLPTKDLRRLFAMSEGQQGQDAMLKALFDLAAAKT